jgi:hypothetical protein
MSEREEAVTLTDMFCAAESEAGRLDVWERIGHALTPTQLAHRAALRGICLLIERLERSPVVMAELKRIVAAERAAAEQEAAEAQARERAQETAHAGQ